MTRVRIGISALVVICGFSACGPEEAPDDSLTQVQSALTTARGSIASPVVVNWNQMKVFLRDANNGLTRLDYNGSSWLAPVRMGAPLGGAILGDPTAVSWGSNRVDAFVRGTDNRLWTTFWEGGAWSGFIPVKGAGALGGSPTAVSAGVNRLDVVYRNSAGEIGSAFWNGTSWQFAFMPEAVEDRIAAVVAQGTVHIIYRRADGRIRHSFKTDRPDMWENPEPLSLPGATATDSPSAVVFNNGSIGVYFRDADGLLNQAIISGGTSGLGTPLFPGQILGSPSPLLWSQGTRQNIFVLDAQKRLVNYWRIGTSTIAAWRGPDLLDSTTLDASPASIAWSFNPSRLNVFVRAASNGHLYNKWWDGSQWRGLDFLGGGPYP